ncbi:MAG TPA: carboxypeptidase regulatory-like domain-containing protein, partial [Candidatus Baltobacteraceae bacterium]|nr:carboxypeptidase regulatory-like domain-containing protein [Candidatus Baltobacteraceae bacterium]
MPHVAAAQIARASIDGTVVDAGDGIPLAGAQVDLVGRPDRTSSDARGHFHFVGLMPGEYRLSVRDEGYQPVVSEPIDVRGSNVAPTLALARSTAELRTIAVTAARPAQSLLESSTFARTLTTEELRRQGITRAADALRQLPGVNNGITGDTAAPGDDINLSLRGIGTLETVAAIDGHPIGY